MSEGCCFLLDMCAGAIGLCNFFEIKRMHSLNRNPAFKFGNVRFKGRRLTDGPFVLFFISTGLKSTVFIYICKNYWIKIQL